MTTTINASTSSGLVVTPDNSGNVVLQYNGQSAPAFLAYLGTTQSISHDTFTKVLYDTETFDTNNNFASSRFTPTVAGYYQICWTTSFSGTTSRNYAYGSDLYKNGSRYTALSIPVFYNSQTNGYEMSSSMVLYMNGSTDYLEVYAYAYDYTAGASSSIRGGTPLYSFFSGCLLRGA